MKRNKKLLDRTFLHNLYLGFNYKNNRYDVKIPLSCDLVEVLNKLKTIRKYQTVMNIDKKMFEAKCDLL